MMSYEEMTQSVLEKVKMRKAAQIRRNKCVAFATCVFCCAILAVGVIQRLSIPADPIISEQNNPITESTDTPTNGDIYDIPRITLLTAMPGGEAEMTMPFNLEVPYKAEIRVHNISGLTDTELQQIIQEERDYVRRIAEENALDYSYSPSIRENVCITSISLGCFSVRFDDIGKVDRIRAAVTDNGRLYVIPRFDGCSNSAYGKMSIIDIDGQSLRKAAIDDEESGLKLYWHSSVEAADRINASPDMDLSCVSDAITIIVNYTDGREESATVYVRVNSEGQVSAILAESVVVQTTGIKQ